MICHFLEKGPVRSKRLGVANSPSAVMCSLPYATDDCSTVHPYLVTCEDCKYELVKQYIDTHQLAPTGEEFDETDVKVYCRCPKGELYYVNTDHYEVFKAFPDGSRDHIVYPIRSCN